MGGAGPLFDDGKDDGAMRTIGEVSKALGIKQHVLRYWEQQFPMLTPLKRSGGRRLYRSEDVAMVQTIDRLVNREGYTLKGAKAAIAKGQAGDGDASVSQPTPEPEPPEQRAPTNADILPQLRAIRTRLAAALEG
ncbi:MerR family transcriptional regulator [Altererythrobacter sp. CAU 1778]